jgi:hypothetical protein
MLRDRVVALVVVCAAALVWAAPASAAPASAATASFFRTPSGLIRCAYTTGPTFLRCDTQYRTRFSGTKRCVEGDYGQGFGMTKTGRSRPLCISDSVYNRAAKVLRYGATRRYGPFVCRSRRTGLTCTNRRGHGWTLARETQRVF